MVPVAVAVAVATLVVAGLLAPVAASAATPSCTFTSQSVTVVAPGASVLVACAGLTPSAQVVLNEESPLAAIVSPATAAPNEASAGTAITVTADANGAFSATFTIPSTFVAADPAAQCPPTQAQVNAGLTVCVLTVRDPASGSTVAPPGQLVYTGQPQPTVTPSIISTNGTTFVSGDTVTFSGAGFWGDAAGGVPAVLFGAAPATPAAVPATISATSYTCDAAGCNGAAGTLVAGGAVSGGVIVPAGLVAGPTIVSVEQPNASPFFGNGPSNSVSATTTVTVLGNPTAAANPADGGTGTPVQVTGTGWDPQGGPAALAFLTPSPGSVVSTSSAAVDANGNLSGAITVAAGDALGTNPIVVTQGSRTAQAAYTVTNTTTTCIGTSCTTNQVVTQVVGAGTLTLSEEASGVSLSAITLTGDAQQSIGRISTVTVVDLRGTLDGWQVTGTMAGDFVNATGSGTGDNNVIPAGNLQWVPSVALSAPDSGVLTQVASGATAALSTSVGATLCTAPRGGGGGSYACDAALVLAIPASIARGVYTATLNLTIT